VYYGSGWGLGCTKGIPSSRAFSHAPALTRFLYSLRSLTSRLLLWKKSSELVRIAKVECKFTSSTFDVCTFGAI
jgi:hypothetical protein